MIIWRNPIDRMLYAENQDGKLVALELVQVQQGKVEGSSLAPGEIEAIMNMRPSKTPFDVGFQTTYTQPKKKAKAKGKEKKAKPAIGGGKSPMAQRVAGIKAAIADGRDDESIAKEFGVSTAAVNYHRKGYGKNKKAKKGFEAFNNPKRVRTDNGHVRGGKAFLRPRPKSQDEIEAFIATVQEIGVKKTAGQYRVSDQSVNNWMLRFIKDGYKVQRPSTQAPVESVHTIVPPRTLKEEQTGIEIAQSGGNNGHKFVCTKVGCLQSASWFSRQEPGEARCPKCLTVAEVTTQS